MKRAFDLVLALCASLLLAIPILIVALMVKLTSAGPVLYWSERVGRRNQNFYMPKFRSMRVGTPAVATHLLQNPGAFLTPVGSFIRRTRICCVSWLVRQ